MPLVFAPETSGESASPIAIAGGWWMLGGALTFSGSYSTGGDALAIAKFIPMLSTLRRVVVVGSLRGLEGEYIVATSLLKLWIAMAANVPTEHTAAAYNAGLTGSPVPVAFLCK